MKLYLDMEQHFIVRVVIPRIIYLLTAGLLIYCFGYRRKAIPRENTARLVLGIIELPLFLIMGENNLLNMLLMKILFESAISLMEEYNAQRHPFAFIFLAVLGAFYFFATGHGNQTSTLQVNKGFIGFEKFNVYISGALVWINTFASLIYSTIYFLILVEQKGDDALIDSPAKAHRSYQKATAALQYFIYFLLSLLFTCINCLHNHESLLLIYDFAPKYIFDFCITMFVLAMVAIFYAFY